MINDDTKVRQFPARDFRYSRYDNAEGNDEIKVFPIEPGMYENYTTIITDAIAWDDDATGATQYASNDALETVLQECLAF